MCPGGPDLKESKFRGSTYSYKHWKHTVMRYMHQASGICIVSIDRNINDCLFVSLLVCLSCSELQSKFYCNFYFW